MIGALRTSRGAILIFALWALTFLALIAAQLSVSVRQRITVLERLGDRIELRTLAEAGVRKAVSVLNTYKGDKGFYISGVGKELRSNNPERFARIQLGQGEFSIYYRDENNDGEAVPRYGMMDELSKLNLNRAKASQIEKLLILGLKMNEEEAEDLALALVDWRSEGDTELIGFYSDEYYDNLQFPYPPKKADFETWDEVLLVRGMTGEYQKKMQRFFTVYGSGAVNINTASWQVMSALGVSDALAAKILAIRRGPDGRESTADDFIFDKSYDVAGLLSESADMKAADIEQIDAWNRAEMMATESPLYFIQSEATLHKSGEKKVIVCVIDAEDDKIKYWREE